MESHPLRPFRVRIPKVISKDVDLRLTCNKTQVNRWVSCSFAFPDRIDFASDSADQVPQAKSETVLKSKSPVHEISNFHVRHLFRGPCS